MNINIDQEFKKLIPPLSSEEYAGLEASIVADGCLAPLVVWDGILIDGHNRFEICTRHDIQFQTRQVALADRRAARIWIRNHQMHRRNIPEFVRVEMGLENEAEYAAEAKERESVGRPKKGVEILPHDTEPARTRDVIGKAAGVSGRTVDKVKKIKETGTQEIQQAVRDGRISISAAAEIATLPAQEQIQIAKSEDAPVAKIAKAIKSESCRIKKEKREEAVREQTKEATKKNQPAVFCRDAIDWLKEQEPCDLLLTDPPYMTDVDDIQQFAASWLPVALAKVKTSGRAFVCVGAYPEEIAAYLAVAMPKQILVWTYRNTIGPSPNKGYKLNWQAILYYEMPDAPNIDCPLMVEQFSVQDINAPDGRLGNRFHAWQKPSELSDRFIRHSTKQGDVVMDPFCCTGTFLLSAAKLGRIGIGCDMSHKNLCIAEELGCLYDQPI